MVKGGPAPQSRLITVGDSPMVALYKISKVFAFPSFYHLTRSQYMHSKVFPSLPLSLPPSRSPSLPPSLPPSSLPPSLPLLSPLPQDSGTVNVTEVVSAVASKMTRSVLGKLSQAGSVISKTVIMTPAITVYMYNI